MNRDERIFRHGDLPQLPPVTGPGTLVLASPGCRLSGLDRTPPPGPVIHVPTRSPLRLCDLQAAPGVAALTLTTGKVDTDTRLAAALATHLRRLRSTPQSDVGPIVTTAAPGEAPMVAGLTKILHFATLHAARGLVDRAVWEWITPAAAATWFSGPLPDVTHLHHHVDVLLQLRRAARERQLPATSDGAEAAARLQGRYWSGRWLLENHLLVGRLVNCHFDHFGLQEN